ncbi:MAG: hypothetical protein IJB73_01400 [Firmicutes bacterium]|nr:hypothetical protein [Bacillota bacterium]
MKKYIVMLLVITCMTILPACSEDTGNTCTTETNPENYSVPAEKLSGEPPVLTVICGDKSVNALSGNYEWELYDGGELDSAAIACGVHPLQCKDITPVLNVPGGSTVSLTFGDAPLPGRLNVTCYDAADWDNMDAPGHMLDIMESAPPQIRLAKSAAIYVVNAEWNSEAGYGGSAEYSFCTE